MDEAERIKVLIVDDSAFARKVLREALGGAAGIEVVGYARDGLEALEKTAELDPDVLTLDLRMPNLDGLGVLRALPADGGPRVVVVTTSSEDSEAALEALEAGAFEVLHKPTALATAQLYEISAPLVAMVRAAAAARRRPRPARPAAPPAPRPPRAPTTTRLVAIGASTGGPQAVARVLQELPPDFPIPIAVVVHMPPGYTAGFARRLDGECAIEVREAEEGLAFRPGRAVIALAGRHLKVVLRAGSPLARIDALPAGTTHRPSVDVLFESAAGAMPRGSVLGVILTGMGDDGLAGARAIRAAGGKVIVEAEESCAVYGMPRAVAEAGLAAAQVPIERMAEAIIENL